MTSLSTTQKAKLKQEVLLPDTLALRVQFLREERGLTPKGLVEKTNLELSLLEDVEAGLVLFLAPSVRQQIARALRVHSNVIFEVEKRPDVEAAALSQSAATEMLFTALNGDKAMLNCPKCSAALHVRLFERFDIENNPITAVKITCTKCLFKLEHS